MAIRPPSGRTRTEYQNPPCVARRISEISKLAESRKHWPEQFSTMRRQDGGVPSQWRRSMRSQQVATLPRGNFGRAGARPSRSVAGWRRGARRKRFRRALRRDIYWQCDAASDPTPFPAGFKQKAWFGKFARSCQNNVIILKP